MQPLSSGALVSHQYLERVDHNVLLGLFRRLPLPGLFPYLGCPPFTDLNATHVQPLGQKGWCVSPWTVGRDECLGKQTGIDFHSIIKWLAALGALSASF